MNLLYPSIWRLELSLFMPRRICLVLLFQSVLAGLESKDWISVCDALNNVRRLSIFHKEAMLHML